MNPHFHLITRLRNIPDVDEEGRMVIKDTIEELGRIYEVYEIQLDLLAKNSVKIDMLTSERDQVRRYVCIDGAAFRNEYSGESKIKPEDVARIYGWDCFEKSHDEQPK